MRSISQFVVVPCLIMLLLSCSSVSTRSYAAAVVDQNQSPIRGATVVPLASTRTGLRVGADGEGPESGPTVFIAAPFLWDSGNELRPPHLRSSATMIAPMVVVGKDVRLHKWLILKKGHYPMLVTNERSSIYYSGGPVFSVEGQGLPPFILRSGGEVKRGRIVDALSAHQPDIETIRAFFDWEIDQVEVSSKGKEIIRMQK